MTNMKEEWLFPNAFVPVDVETTSALVAEIKRLIDVVGGMALAQPEHPAQMARLGWQYVECPACGLEGARAFPKPEQEPVDQYATEEDIAELLRVGQLPKPLRLAAMLEKTLQWPLHGKSADCLREMYELLRCCENEMRYAGWTVQDADNYARNDLYEEVKSLLEKNK